MSRSLLALAVCATAAVHAEPLPLISNDAKYCVKPDVCDTVIVTAINSPDAALNAYADSLFNSAYADSLFNTETAAEYRFTGFDHAALEAWITRVGKEELGDGEDVPNNDYSHDYGVTQIGETAHYRQLEFIVSTYLGGAHGMYGSSFHVLPKAGELRRLTLDDILLPGQRQKLDQLQKQAFERALKADGYGSGAMSEAEIKELYDTFPFTANDNWRFDSKGLVFQYAPYEITPYSLGAPEILVPTAELHGIIKPDILAELPSWHRYDAGKAEKRPQWRQP